MSQDPQNQPAGTPWASPPPVPPTGPPPYVPPAPPTVLGGIPPVAGQWAPQTGPCPSCANAFGPGLACQACRQLAGAPPGVRVAGPGKRFGSYLLGIPLYVVTLGIGYLVWLLIAWSRGQNPAQQVLHMKVAKLAERRVATWGDMFVRNFVVMGLLFGVVGIVLLYLPLIIGALFALGGPLAQTGWDRMVGTIVVDDPNNLLS